MEGAQLVGTVQIAALKGAEGGGRIDQIQHENAKSMRQEEK